MSSELKRFLDAKKTNTRLIGNLERHLLQRPPGNRSTTVLHPSEIIKKDWCMRGSYFLLNGETKIAEKPPLKLQSVFDTGHAVHSKWQGYFQEMGILHGQFKCQACHWITWGTSPESCDRCGKPDLIYAEVTLSDDSLRIKGHTDGWIKDSQGDALIEIKSVGPGTLRFEAPELMKEADGDFMKAWKAIKRPFSSHILQGQMYLELMKRMGHEEVTEIIFLYELKADQDYREFEPVKADFGLVEHIFDKAKVVVDSVNAGVVPECTNNPSGTCKQCDPYKE
jgi:hypothetical protein